MGKKKPLLSIGMIVKNESRCLEKCLKALGSLRKAVPCELVIADTGSDDGTREIAARYADILLDFPWIGDFSAARNAVLDRCSGTWYLTVDADEYLDDCSELVQFLKSGLAKTSSFGTVIQRNHATMTMDGDYSDFPALRLARMSGKLRYVGAIHEAWPVRSDQKIMVLKHTVLQHDGYVYPSLKEKRRKMQRNMKILEQELAKEPGSPRRLLQCIESGYDVEKRNRYARMGVEVIRRKEKDWDYFGPPMYRGAILAASENHLPELEDWIEEARRLFPHSMHIRLDVAYLSACSAYVGREEEKLLLEIPAYWKAVEDYDHFRYSPKELFSSGLFYTGFSTRDQVRLMEADALRRLGRYEEMKERLKTVKGSVCTLPNLQNYLGILYASWEKIALSDTLRELYQELFHGDDNQFERRELFNHCTSSAFYPPDDESYAPPYPLIAELDCDLGRAAKVMLAETAEEIGRRASEISDWTQVPTIMVKRLLDFNVPLPPVFYAQGVERFEELAAGLAALYKDQYTGKVLSYSRSEDFFETTARFVWLFGLVIAAIQAERWENADSGQALSDLFASLSADYLSNFYNAQVLTEEDISVLPAVHRFGWYYVRGRKADDRAEYVRALQAGLKSAPSMKKMVNFLTEQIEKSIDMDAGQTSTELLELAEKVKAALAAYPDGDPAVEALMASPAYQRVKHLIHALR